MNGTVLHLVGAYGDKILNCVLLLCMERCELFTMEKMRVCRFCENIIKDIKILHCSIYLHIARVDYILLKV